MTRHKKWFLFWRPLILNIRPKYHVVITIYDKKHLKCVQKIPFQLKHFSLFTLRSIPVMLQYKFILLYNHLYLFFWLKWLCSIKSWHASGWHEISFPYLISLEEISCHQIDLNFTWHHIVQIPTSYLKIILSQDYLVLLDLKNKTKQTP